MNRFPGFFPSHQCSMMIGRSLLQLRMKECRVFFSLQKFLLEDLAPKLLNRKVHMSSLNRAATHNSKTSSIGQTSSKNSSQLTTNFNTSSTIRFVSSLNTEPCTLKRLHLLMLNSIVYSLKCLKSSTKSLHLDLCNTTVQSLTWFDTSWPHLHKFHANAIAERRPTFIITTDHLSPQTSLHMCSRWQESMTVKNWTGQSTIISIVSSLELATLPQIYLNFMLDLAGHSYWSLN